MALTGADKADRKLVNQFLREGPAQSGFLGELDNRITSNRATRRAAQQTNRAIGVGAFEGASPFRNSPMVNPSGAGGRAIMQQGMGPVQPVGSPAALPPASRGLPAVRPGGGGVVPTGNLPVPANQAGQMGQGALGAGPGAGPAQATYARPPAPAAVGRGATAMGPGTTARAAAASKSAANAAGAAAAQGADDVAAAASRQAGAAAAQAGPAGVRAAASNMGVNITKAGMMRGSLVAGAGVMASQFIDGMNLGGEQSILDKGASGALLGAGLGGGAAIALGLGSGPVGWAALGGAALFAGGRALFGGDDTKLETATKAVDETRETITELAGMYGIEGDALSDIMMQYDTSTRMLIDQKDTGGLKNFMAGISTQLPALMLQAREQQKAGDQETQRYEAMMQTQAQFAPMFEKSLDRANQASQTAYQTANQTATYLDQRQPQLAALYRQTAAQSQASAANLQAAYARQMSQAPQMTGQLDEIERQVAQQELMNQQLAGIGQFP
jgi:hypothetical protein